MSRGGPVVWALLTIVVLAVPSSDGALSHSYYAILPTAAGATVASLLLGTIMWGKPGLSQILFTVVVSCLSCGAGVLAGSAATTPWVVCCIASLAAILTLLATTVISVKIEHAVAAKKRRRSQG